MRLSILPIVASCALLAAPAFAAMPGATASNPQAATPSATAPSYTQNQGATAAQPYAAAPRENMPNEARNQALSGSSQPNAEASSQNMASNTMQVDRDTQQKLEQSLEQSGFHDVTVAPRTFIIHAKAPDGSRIVMVVGPDMAHGVIMSGSSSPPNSSMQNGSMNAEHNGMSNTEQGK